MKKILLSFLVALVFSFTTKIQAQCTVSNLAIQIISYNTSTCQVNFNISFEQEVNSGNKFAYIHLWKDAAYHTPAAAWPSGGGAIYSGSSQYPEAAQLVNALATIVIELNGTANPTIGTTYHPDATVSPLSAGLSIVKTILPGGLTERETISGLSLNLSPCPGVVTIKGDIWASQAANGKIVHCAVQGLTFDINNPQITSAFKVCNPRSISFSIKNNGTVNLTEHFVLYKDDGDGIFEPFTGAGGDGPAIYTYSPDTTLAPGGTQSRTQFAYPGSNTPGENASLWLEVVVPTTGYTTVAFISHTASGCLSLPVNIVSFTATRKKSDVMLKWETNWEQNSNGFAVERNINGSWQEVGFVPSQAPGGNSSDLLSYQFVDVNDAKGISQYRLRQVDFNNMEKFSEIRTVRGESQVGKIIIYPNPTFNGVVNVSFEDASVLKDVSLIDMSGRVLQQWKALRNNQVTIENLTPGMYSLRVVIPETGEQSVEKIVVNKR